MKNRFSWVWWTAVILFILWMFFTLSAYYVAQKPLDAASIQTIFKALGEWSVWSFSLPAVFRSLLDVGAALWLAFMALGVGLWFWRWLAPREAGDLDALLFSLGLGFAAVGLLVLFLGLAGLLSRTVLYGAALALTAVSLPTAAPFLRRIRWRQRPSRLVMLYLAVTLTLTLTLALLPPTAWDSLSYHLRGPWLYLQAGRIHPGVDVFSLNNPFLLEMLFMLGMALRSDAAAQLVHFTFGLLLAGMVYAITVRGLQLQSGWTAVLLLFATPMFMLLAPWAYNDLALAFVILGSLYAYGQWRNTGDWRWLLLSGLFSGLALSFKYTSFITPFLIGLLIIWQYRRRPAALLKPLLLFSLAAAGVAVIWYIKNWAFTGNPVYPFVFDGRFWDEYRTLAHRNPGSGIGFNLLPILKAPYTLTLGIADVSGDGPTGPLFLLFLPLLLLYGLFRPGRRAPFAFRLLLLYALFHYGFWLLGVIFSANLWQGRLMLPALAALCPAIAWIIDDLSRFDHPQFSLRRFVNLALAFVLLLGLVSQLAAWWAANPLPYIAGTQPRAAWLERHMGNLYRASEEINETLPADAVVQFLWEPRTYYCLKDCRGDHILDKYAHMAFLYGDAASIAAALQEEGVTHILVHEAGWAYIRENEPPWVIPADVAEYQRFLAEYAFPVNNWGEGYTLYELRP